MRAVDTNVVVRLVIAEDDPAQTARAEAELDRGLFVSHGVLMETEWVLRGFYKLGRAEISDALAYLIDHPAVVTEQAPALRWALDRYGNGADFADMLHLVASAPHDEFASFDARLSRHAGINAPVRVVHLT